MLGWIFKMALGAALYALYVGDLKLPESLRHPTEDGGIVKNLSESFKR